MTHAPSAGSTVAPPPTMLSTPGAARGSAEANRRQLDRDGLRAGVVARQRELAAIEAAMVATCEQAAARGADRHVRIDDRGTWDRGTWDRYLAAAARHEPDYGPRLRRLYQEIDQLERLVELPLAA